MKSPSLPRHVGDLRARRSLEDRRAVCDRCRGRLSVHAVDKTDNITCCLPQIDNPASLIWCYIVWPSVSCVATNLMRDNITSVIEEGTSVDQ